MPDLWMGEICACSAAVDRVLFVGNSLTDYNDLPLQVEALVSDLGAKPKLKTEAITAPGVGLKYHLTPEYSGALDAIRSSKFDFVVIQGSTLSDPFEDPEGFIVNALTLTDEVNAAGAEPILYETWAFDPGGNLVKTLKIYVNPRSGGNPEDMQARIRDTYVRVTSKANGHMACVGDAWEKILSECPEIKLHISDGIHPRECGSLGSWIKEHRNH